MKCVPLVVFNMHGNRGEVKNQRLMFCENRSAPLECPIICRRAMLRCFERLQRESRIGRRDGVHHELQTCEHCLKMAIPFSEQRALRSGHTALRHPNVSLRFIEPSSRLFINNTANDMQKKQHRIENIYIMNTKTVRNTFVCVCR